MPTKTPKIKEVLDIKNEIKHTAHSGYRCEYHIVFAPKYRRKVIYNQLRKDVGEIMRKLHSLKLNPIYFYIITRHLHLIKIKCILYKEVSIDFTIKKAATTNSCGSIFL